MTARAVGADEALDVVIAMHRLMRRLRRAGHTGAVHPTQLIVLALLMQYGPLRIGELARRVPCSQPTATTAQPRASSSTRSQPMIQAGSSPSEA